ncbi:MAG: hypothetical protein J7L10_02850 [Methanomicrobia archaeon]|nr:hypothetical protein [Methanomicrobia archaeon]RLG02142.1 MAG: hypothetical protein DRN58_00040 [Thermococci archaeon]
MDSKAKDIERREWKKIVDRILEKEKCLVLTLGYIDTGKTSFLKYASKKIKENGKKVSIIDCDVGQSNIGPPGCLGLLNDSGKSFYYFIGDVYPYDHSKVITGLLELLSRVDSSYILIDTTGLIFGKGRSLKRAKIMSLKPDLIIAFQRNHELEGILKNFPQYEIIRENVENVEFTSREKRKEIRKKLWKKHLKNSQIKVFKLKDIKLRNTFLFSGMESRKDIMEKILGMKVYWCEKIPEGFFIVADEYGEQENTIILKKGFEEGLIVGFIKNEICIGIGMIIRVDFERKEIYILTNTENDFDFIEFGRIKINGDGEELGRVYNLVY